MTDLALRADRIQWVRPARPWVIPAVLSLVVGEIVAHVMPISGWDQPRLAGTFIALGAIVLALRPSRWLWGVVALVAAWWLAVVLARYTSNVINPGPPVGLAVGGAALAGTPYTGTEIGGVLSVGIPALIALATLWRPRRLRAARTDERTDERAGERAGERTEERAVERAAEQETAAGGSRSLIGLWVGLVVAAFVLVPDLEAYLVSLIGPVPPSSWDAANLTAWQGYVQMGLVPMKDFFYPYGFQWLYTDGSAGPVYQWLVQSAILVVAGLSVWRLSGRRVWRTLACVVVIALAGPWAEAWRYLPALLVAVAYGAVGPARRPRPLADDLLLFAACLLAVFVEADLLAIGLVGAVMVSVGELVAGRIPGPPRRVLSALALDALPLLLALLVIVVVWTALGMTSGELRFLTNFSAVSSQSATNESAGGALGLSLGHLNANLLYAAAPALLATAGLLWARARDLDGPAVAPILLGAAGVTMMMMLKHFVRSISDEVITATEIALAWALILLWRRESLRRIVVCSAGVAAILTLLAQVGGLSLTQYYRNAVAAPGRAVRSVKVAFNARERRTAAQNEFDPARFQGWPDLAIASDFARSATLRGPSSFAIVGDAPLTYVLLGQSPPYQSELYDASPVAQQEKMLSELQRRNPAYVIWRQDGQVDIVPYDVRDPIIYAWMIRNYVPLRSFKTWDILRRRRPGEALPAAFWRSQLGTVEDLGYIPSYSTATGSSRCTGGGGCVRYGVAHGAAPAGTAVRIALSGEHRTFTVTLSVRAGVQDYPVRLDRLWFWPLMGPSPTLRSLTPGFTVHDEGRQTGNDLY